MLSELTLKEVSEGLRVKKFKSSELTEEVLKRSEKINPELNAYITMTPEVARKAASEADQRAAKDGLLSALDGVPGALKDIVNTKGILSTSASKILSNFVPPYNATVAEKLFQGGLVLT